jgi:hypothetical protein
VNEAVLVALIAAFPPTVAAVLAYLGSRSVRRQVATGGQVPIGMLVDRLQQKVEGLQKATAETAERLARMEGREVVPRHLGRRLEKLDDDLRALGERVARVETGGPR